eukprot:m.241118 g.241118  ORF g.241118 m.241118 type:complete len:229 (+) comp18026_c0_seq1:62-748(+)
MTCVSASGKTWKGMMMDKWTALFAVPALLYVVIPSYFGEKGYLVKMSPILVLLMTVLAKSKRIGNFECVLLVCGLWLSSLGDVALALEDNFLQGLIYFRAAHFFYMLLFGRGLEFRWGVAIVASSIAVVSIVLMYPKLSSDSSLFLPVVSYTLVITGMLFTSACGTKHCRTLGILGAGLFAISDFLISVNKFMVPFPYHQVFIHTIYYSGQFFIAHSILASSSSKKNN